MLAERKMTEKEAVRIALKAFHLDEWIDGTADGGITSPRIILNITFSVVPNGSKVEIEYKYPAESHPCSDVTYHLSDPDRTYSSIYVLTDNRELYREDSEKLFKNADVFLDLVENSINAFFSENDIKEVRP